MSLKKTIFNKDKNKLVQTLKSDEMKKATKGLIKSLKNLRDSMDAK